MRISIAQPLPLVKLDLCEWKLLPLEKDLAELKHFQLESDRLSTPLSLSPFDMKQAEDVEELEFTLNKDTTDAKTLAQFVNVKWLHLQTLGSPLGSLLRPLTKLEGLILDNAFDSPLGDSLAGLDALKFVHLGRSFNQSLDNTVLPKDATIVVGSAFKQPVSALVTEKTYLQKIQDKQQALVYNYNPSKPFDCFIGFIGGE